MRVERDKEIKNELAQKIGRRIRLARAEAGITQEELSKRSGISRQVIYRLETGIKETTIYDIMKVATAVGKPIEYFFQDIETAVGTNNGIVSLEELDSDTRKIVQAIISRLMENKTK